MTRPGDRRPIASLASAILLAASVLGPWLAASAPADGASTRAATTLGPAAATACCGPAAPAAGAVVAPAPGTADPGSPRAPVSRAVVDGIPEPSVPGVPAAPAAVDGLDVTTATTYEIDPGDREVRVGVDITAVNRLADSAGLRYYYPAVDLALQPEATSITADQSGARDHTTTQARTGYRLLSIRFQSQLYAGESASVHLDFVLPAGAPRSTSSVRVGAAYSAFVAWAFGDRGTVEVDVPGGFTVTTSGNRLADRTLGDGQHTLSATVADPTAWYAWIDARNDAALTSEALKLPGDEQVVVRSWPEDAAWRRRVAQTLTSGIPVLLKKIGLPWPVSGQLTVLEVSNAMLEGYAGFYSASTHEITVSEDLNPLTIVHEASHAWFNASLFTDRWITEGLANEYAYRTLKAIGVSASGPPDTRTSSPVAFPLDTWGPPAPIKTRTQDTREQWAYDASWTVMREVVDEVGERGMARVFAAAEAGTTAYPGAGTPEAATLPADWRRFVDLAEEVGGGTGVAEIIAPWVLTPAERAELAPRRAARTAYHALVASGAGWAAPTVVRMDLDGWDFAAAQDAMVDATRALRERDAIRTTAAAEGLKVPTPLKGAYEGATDAAALARAADDEASLRRALDTVAAADAAVAAPRDGLVALGLLGSDPAATLAAARRAWEAGDAPAAQAQASAVTDQIAVAADAGRLRLVSIVAGALALALLVGVVAAARRRARRAQQPAEPAAAVPVAPDPSPILPASAGVPVPPERRPDAEDE